MHHCRYCDEDDCECLGGALDCIGCRICREGDDELDEILNAPCGRCGSPECFGGCEVGAADEPQTRATTERRRG